jgi:tetratricopeptide (TPR) repeat protein
VARCGLAALRDGLALAERHELHSVALRGYTNFSDSLEMLGRHAEAAQIATAGVTLATRVGHARSHGAMLVGNLAEPLIRLGRWHEALDLITESLAEDPNGIFASALLLARGELRLWQGDADAAANDVREARRQFGDGTDVQFTAPMVGSSTPNSPVPTAIWPTPSNASRPRWPGRSAPSAYATPGHCYGSACVSKQTSPHPAPAPRNTRRCTPWPPPCRPTRRPHRHTRR